MSAPVKPGDEFGKLRVLHEDGRNSYGQRVIKCECACGRTKNVSEHHLKHRTRSCGCDKRAAHNAWSRAMFGSRSKERQQ